MNRRFGILMGQAGTSPQATGDEPYDEANQEYYGALSPGDWG